MKIYRLNGRSGYGFVSFGSVWEEGELTQAEFELINEKGEAIPVQSRILSYWPDGSIKWASHVADSQIIGKYGEIRPGTGNHERILKINRNNDSFFVDTGKISLTIPAESEKSILFEKLSMKGQALIREARPVLLWEHPLETDQHNGLETGSRVSSCIPRIKNVELEEAGNLCAVFRLEGSFMEEQRETAFFIIRMYLGAGSDEIRFVHSFFYNGDVNRDYLKGLGIRFQMNLSGRAYNRHIKFGLDSRVFHETAILLNSNYPKLSDTYLKKQMKGVMENYEEDSDVEKAVADLPVWNRYWLCQDSDTHFSVKNKQEQPFVR